MSTQATSRHPKVLTLNLRAFNREAELHRYIGRFKVIPNSSSASFHLIAQTLLIYRDLAPSSALYPLFSSDPLLISLIS